MGGKHTPLTPGEHKNNTYNISPDVLYYEPYLQEKNVTLNNKLATKTQLYIKIKRNFCSRLLHFLFLRHSATSAARQSWSVNALNRR